MIEVAKSLVGHPAVKYHGSEYGTMPEEGFDCSGLVTYVLNQAGLHIPQYFGYDGKLRDIRHANEYWDHYGALVHDGQEIPGDLIVFSRNGVSPTHIGILVDDGKYVHANIKKGVVESECVIKKRIPSTHTGERQLYIRNPIGYKTLVVAAKSPTPRYHGRLLE